MGIFASRDGQPWEPEYLTAIDGDVCIGCGRCFKVCSREVMHLMGVDENGKLVACSLDDDEDDEEEFVRKVMVLDNAGGCIGCGACGRVCPKNYQTHEKASTLAA